MRAVTGSVSWALLGFVTDFRGGGVRAGHGGKEREEKEGVKETRATFWPKILAG